MRIRALALVGLVALTASCKAVGPDYERPHIALDPRMPEVAAVATSAPGRIQVTEGPPIVGDYWEVFHDERLNALVREAVDGNQDLHAALARVLVARAVVREDFAPLFPSMTANGTYAYAKLPAFAASSAGAANPFTSGPFSGQPFQALAGYLGLSYEVDIWGRVRRLLESANDTEIASEEDRKNVEITVVNDTLQTYFDLCQADTDVAIAADSVAVATSSLAIVRERYTKGFATELDLRRAEALLASQRAQVPAAELDRAVAAHKLAILLGHMPDLHFDGKPPTEFDLPPEIPTGAPAELLERRPDIRAAEARLASSNAKIGSVIASFFPKVSIFGYLGQATVLDFKNIGTHLGNFYAVGPSISLPLFQGGLTYGQLLEARGQTEENEATYRQTVLRAFGEVADAIISIDRHEKQRGDLGEQVRALVRSVELANVQYRTGFVTFLDVLDAESALLTARLGDVVSLQRALGGGWHELDPDPFQRDLVGAAVPR
jgi:multidrug efflux system outer membrane protein